MRQLHNPYFKLSLIMIFLLWTSKSFGQTTCHEIIGAWWNQKKVDKKNPNEKLRSKPLLGSNLMYGFTFDENDNIKTHRIYWCSLDGLRRNQYLDKNK